MASSGFVVNASPLITLGRLAARLRARQAAKALGLQLTGTLGILVRARRAGLVPRLSPLIEAMRDIGFYASNAVIHEVLASVGESHEDG